MPEPEASMQAKAAMMRIAREVLGWAAATQRYTQATQEVNTWLRHRIGVPGSAQARKAIDEAARRMRPIFREYAVGMSSATRQVENALRDADSAWRRTQGQWQIVDHQTRTGISNSLTELANESQSVAATTEGTQGSLRNLIGAIGNTPEAEDALGATAAAVRGCRAVANFASMAKRILEG